MTSVIPTAGELRVRAWLEVREALERQLEPLGRAAMAALSPARGERVLDIGCGIGTTPSALARLVGPDGEVVAVDLLGAALDVLREDRDLPANVSLLHGDAQALPFEPGRFDAVFSRFGLMFFAEPVAAFANLRRALRPGGRIAFVCWRSLEENELDHLPLRAAAPHLPAEALDDAAGSGWFSLSEAPAIRATLAAAGFVDVQVRADDRPVASGGLEAMVAVCSRVGALGAILRTRPDLRDTAVPALRRALGQRDGPGGPSLTAATWIVSARAPG